MKWNNLDEYLIEKENKNRFHDLIRKMPLFYADVFCQYFLGNKKITDIAKEYGRSVTWINIIRHRSYNFISVYMNNEIIKKLKKKKIICIKVTRNNKIIKKIRPIYQNSKNVVGKDSIP